MLSTAQNIPFFNQKNMLKNSQYDLISFNSKSDPSKYSFLFIKGNIAHIEQSGEAIVYRKSYPLELFVSNEPMNEKVNNTNFYENNIYLGELKDLSSHEGSLDIALSYNAAKKLNIGIGDQVSLYFEKDFEVYVYPVTVKVILKPMYSDENKMYGGIGYGIVNHHFISFLNNHGLSYEYAKFIRGKKTFRKQSGDL